MTESRRQIFLFTALPCEARPLVERFKLKKDTAVRPFEIYGRDEFTLTVTGLGKAAMAAGVGYTMARLHAVEHPILLNVGIAGHRDQGVGSVFLIDKISDRDSSKHFYPPIVFSPPCPTVELNTVSRPEAGYGFAGLVDMEASAFYETAIRFTTAELVHCVKVVSDNAALPSDQITPNRVQQWLRASLPIVDAMVSELTSLASSLDWPESKLLDEIGQRFHVTAHQRLQLKTQLYRWRCLTGGDQLSFDWVETNHARDLLARLDRAIDDLEFRL